VQNSDLLIITVGVFKQYRYYSASFEGPNSVSTKASPASWDITESYFSYTLIHKENAKSLI